jgi:hypothetical protein
VAFIIASWGVPAVQQLIMLTSTDEAFAWVAGLPHSTSQVLWHNPDDLADAAKLVGTTCAIRPLPAYWREVGLRDGSCRGEDGT